MKRFNCRTRKFEEVTEVDEFLKEILSVCKKHNMVLSHEDRHGAFEVENYKDSYEKWLMDANVNISKG